MPAHGSTVGANGRGGSWTWAALTLLALFGMPATADDDPFRIAVLPLLDLSGSAPPLGEIRVELLDSLHLRGALTLPEQELAALMARHRIRWTGGITLEQARAFREEAAVDGVLVTSVDLYETGVPPKVAMTARLVSTTEQPRILWVQSFDITGYESPGWLEQGVVDDTQILIERVAGAHAGSLGRWLDGEPPPVPRRPRRRFRPRSFSTPPDLREDPTVKLRVAVLPFINDSSRKHAGYVVGLHVLRHLARDDSIDLIEPGVVRLALLQSRLIRQDGLSLAQTDALRSLLRVDIVVTGTVMDYLDPRGRYATPQVTFSMNAIDARLRQAVWSSTSYNRGGEKVVFYQKGRVFTAHRLASEMTHAAVESMMKPGDRR